MNNITNKLLNDIWDWLDERAPFACGDDGWIPTEADVIELIDEYNKVRNNPQAQSQALAKVYLSVLFWMSDANDKLDDASKKVLKNFLNEIVQPVMYAEEGNRG